jgi:peroxiredoxin
MRKDLLVIVVVIAVVALMIWSAVYLTRGHASLPSAQSFGLTAPSKLIGAAAPDFTLPSIDGKNVRVADLRGKAVLLNFWATWCLPCKLEMPWFEELQKQYASQGLQVVGVDMDEGSEADVRKKVAAFAKDLGVDYTLVIGKDEVADAYGSMPVLPTTFYIGRDGKILSRVEGLISHKDIEKNIKQALATSVPATTTSTASR